MATNTYVALDKVTIGTATPSITFSSISSAYTDLIIVAQAGINTSNDDLYMQFNSDTATNYSATIIYGNGSSAVSTRATNQTGIPCNWAAALNTAGLYTTFNLHIMNYSNTTTYKSVINRSGSAASTNLGVNVISGLWRSTSAISSITLYTPTRNLSVGSTFSLYGIKSEPTSTAKATGGVVYSDADYYYHVFASTGVFTPSQSLSCDYLVVAGGGGGGGSASNGNGGGGGGAGGFLSSVTTSGGGAAAGSALSLSATSYTVTVGAGGAAGDNSSFTSGNLGTNGTNSTFSSITALGGGGGGAEAVSVDGVSGKGKNGGSGGGGSSNAIAGARGAASSPTQGYRGGYGQSWDGGGGGGAGAVGQDAIYPDYGGTGGIGIYTAITDAIGTGEFYMNHYYLAGGGGGGKYTSGSVPGMGGVGGGGYGGYGESGNLAVAGTPNTGGGGGGNGHGYNAAAGGSGIVIVRYAK